MDDVQKDLKLRNEAYDYLNTFRDHSMSHQAFEYLTEAVKSEQYSNSELKAIVSGLEQCIQDREE